jgi:hypothetical protein
MAASTLSPSLPLGIAADAPQEFIIKVEHLAGERLEEVIARLIKNGVSEVSAQRMRTEFLRFVSLRWLTEQPLVPSRPADEFWHAFILFTRDYAAFCERHFSHFIHHAPAGEGKEEREKIRKGASITGTLITRYFPQAQADGGSRDLADCGSGDGTDCSEP